MKGITVRAETRDGSEFIVAEGPSSHDIARELHMRLIAGINGKIDMEFARQLVRLGWTPPPGHPVGGETVDPYVYWPTSTRDRQERALWMPEAEWREALRLALRHWRKR